MIVHLINYGADLNAINTNGYSPFRRAVDRNFLEICRLMVDAGCDVTKELDWIEVRSAARLI